MAINDNLSNQPPDGVTGREPTPAEVARHDGYVQGRTDENYVQGGVRSQERAVAQARANDNAASGMVFGLCIALLAAGAGAAIYFLMGDRTDVVPVAVPQIQKEKTVEKETTVIERESSAPAINLPDVSVPDVNIQVPEVKAPDVNITNEAPAAPAEPAPEPAAEPAPENEVSEPATAE
ncbi:MAG: hypothetical protein WA949_17595 [Phormidesmis sp.]